jgi:PEGA domain
MVSSTRPTAFRSCLELDSARGRFLSSRMLLRGFTPLWIGIAIIAQSTVARADAAEVEALIAKGNELRRAGTPGPALPYFQKAYELARTPRTTGQLGLAELAAGYPVEAAEHLAAALQSPNDPSIVKYHQALTDALKMARSQIGELAIDGSPAGADVIVDGRAVGTLPLPTTVKLSPRNAEVVVRASGFSPHTELVPIVGGQRHRLTVNLERAPKPAEPAPPVATTAALSPPPAPAAVTAPTTAAPAVVEARPADGGGPSSGLRTTAWIIGGAAVVAAGTGLTLNLVARSKTGDYETWQSYRRWSIVGYVSGAALAVTSAVLFLTSRPSAPTATDHAHVTCAPTLNGLACQTVF